MRCPFCAQLYDIGPRVPKIMINCGHTLCTSCIQQINRGSSVKCPVCRKKIKDIQDAANTLPMNFDILYEVVMRNESLRSIKFEKPKPFKNLNCSIHDKRRRHYFCNFHQVVICRQCTSETHSEEVCFVIDLTEIHKLVLKQIELRNQNQIEINRRDRSYVN